MPALTEDRNTPAREGLRREPPVKAGARIFAGAMVAIGADTFAVPASTALGLKVIGRAEKRADNSAGASGAINVPVGAECYRFANSAAGDAITRADIGANCFAVDDQTVAKTDGAGTRSVAGKIFDVDAQGVWVDFS
jgi:hypothetical protein